MLLSHHQESLNLVKQTATSFTLDDAFLFARHRNILAGETVSPKVCVVEFIDHRDVSVITGLAVDSLVGFDGVFVDFGDAHDTVRDAKVYESLAESTDTAK